MTRPLARAAEEALTVRGTVMLEVDGDERLWCAVCASVQGDLEVRVAEPRRRSAQQWLADHGFTHGIDAWSCPVRHGASANECAAILAAAAPPGTSRCSSP